MFRDVGGEVGKGRELFGEVVHADSLLLVEAADFRNPNVNPQTLLASQEVVKLCIVVRFTAGWNRYHKLHTPIPPPLVIIQESRTVHVAANFSLYAL